MKSKTAQRGFSPIIIVVFIVVALLVGFVVIPFMWGFWQGFTGAVTKDEVVGTDQEKAPAKLFETKETDKYSFVYPSYFVPFTADYIKGAELSYHDPKSDRTEPGFIYLYTIKDPDMKAGQPITNYLDLKECQELFEIQRDSTSTKIDRIEVVNDSASNGCLFVSTTPVPHTSDAVVVVEKVLNPVKSQAGILAYVVKGVFFESDRKEVSQGIELAVDNFKLK